MKFVIFHGSLGSSAGNWFPDLQEKLEYMGQDVICPQFPIDKVEDIKKDRKYKTIQNLQAWFSTFEKEVLPHLNSKDKTCFIGHSLGNVFILHCIEKYKIKLDSAIFVSPCLDKLDLVPWYYDRANTTFYKTDFDFEKLQKHINTSYVIYSDNDPYIEPRKALHFAKVLDSSHILVRQAGHLNSEVNVNEFPLVFDLCVSRLDLNLYQKYVYRKRVDEAVMKIKDSYNKVLIIPKEEINDEGRFHFMNLTKSGFATFLSNAKQWDPEDKYFTAGRDASKRGIPITRVIVVVKDSDLKRKPLTKQIKLDIEAGIEIRVLSYSDLKQIGCDEDFGIWDNEFICTLKRDENGNLIEGVIDSRVKTLLTAQNWRDKIIRKSKKINSADELGEFLKLET